MTRVRISDQITLTAENLLEVFLATIQLDRQKREAEELPAALCQKREAEELSAALCAGDLRKKLTWENFPPKPEDQRDRRWQTAIINGTFAFLAKMGFVQFDPQKDKCAFLTENGIAWGHAHAQSATEAEADFMKRLAVLQSQDGEPPSPDVSAKSGERTTASTLAQQTEKTDATDSPTTDDLPATQGDASSSTSGAPLPSQIEQVQSPEQEDTANLSPVNEAKETRSPKSSGPTRKPQRGGYLTGRRDRSKEKPIADQSQQNDSPEERPEPEPMDDSLQPQPLTQPPKPTPRPVNPSASRRRGGRVQISGPRRGGRPIRRMTSPRPTPPAAPPAPATPPTPATRARRSRPAATPTPERTGPRRRMPPPKSLAPRGPRARRAEPSDPQNTNAALELTLPDGTHVRLAQMYVDKLIEERGSLIEAMRFLMEHGHQEMQLAEEKELASAKEQFADEEEPALPEKQSQERKNTLSLMRSLRRKKSTRPTEEQAGEEEDNHDA